MQRPIVSAAVIAVVLATVAQAALEPGWTPPVQQVNYADVDWVPSPLAYFGHELVIDGDVMLVAGFTGIFELHRGPDGTWQYARKVHTDDWNAAPLGGNPATKALALDGDEAYIAAPGGLPSTEDVGHVRIYDRTGTDLTWVATIPSPTYTEENVGHADGFARAIQKHGDRLYIAAQWYAGGGVIHEYARPPGSGPDAWVLVDTIAPMSGSSFDNFGNRFAVEGDLLVGPQPSVVGNDGTDDYIGRVFTFARGADGWAQTSELPPCAPAGFAGGYAFGNHVAMSDGVAVVGPWVSFDGSIRPRMCAYRHMAGEWAPAGHLAIHDGLLNGGDLAKQGPFVLVGTPEENGADGDIPFEGGMQLWFHAPDDQWVQGGAFSVDQTYHGAEIGSVVAFGPDGTFVAGGPRQWAHGGIDIFRWMDPDGGGGPGGPGGPGTVGFIGQATGLDPGLETAGMAPIADTGFVASAGDDDVRAGGPVFLDQEGVRIAAPAARVHVADAAVTSQATAATVVVDSIALAIHGVESVARASCTGATGAFHVASVTLAGIPVPLATVAPDTVLVDAGGVRVVLNQQHSGPGGLVVTGVRITIEALDIDVKIARAHAAAIC